MNSVLDFGKVIEEKSYFNGKIKSTKVSYTVPEIVRDKNEALREVMKALELIDNTTTNLLNIKIEADPVTHQFKLITTNYMIEKK